MKYQKLKDFIKKDIDKLTEELACDSYKLQLTNPVITYFEGRLAAYHDVIDSIKHIEEYESSAP